MCSSSYDSKISDSTEDSNNVESTSSSFKEEKFTFPPAPRLCKSASNSPCSFSCRSDSSVSDGKLVRTRRRGRRKTVRTLPPIGVFWDIENCQVPRTKSATSVVQRIRELFYADYREAEFLVVCDVKKESPQIIQDLNDAQVNLIHVSSTSKNAADEKLRQSLRRFAELHKAPASVALISSDVNFAADLSDLRYRKKIHVILVHNSNVADALILCASETYNFTSITETIPSVLKNKTVGTQPADLYIYNLPVTVDSVKLLRSRLKLLSDNCGGRVLSINKDLGTAVIRFSSLDFARRAQKRLEGEDVFGNKIRVANVSGARESPFKNYTGRKVRNTDLLYQVPPVSMPPMYGQQGLRNCFYPGNNPTAGNPWRADLDQGLPNAQQPTFMQSMFRPIRGSGFMEVSQIRQPQNALDSAVAPSSIRATNRSYGDLAVDSKPKNAGSFIASSPIELIVSNLDSSINSKELQSILLNMLKQYAMVLNLTITTQSDGSPVANVKVGSQQEAQFVISQLHHQWLGCKRMSISCAQTSSDPNQVRFMIVSLLQEVPGNRMPLFKFFELAESRYHCAISLSEVNKLKDVCKITDGACGRTIVLTPEASISSPVCMYSALALYCTVHCPNGLENRGWGEAEEVVLPNIKISLKLFASKVSQLVISHMGCVPLLSFPVCYANEFGESLPVDETGVPLEHLVTCIANVELSCSGQNKNVKFLKMKDMLKENPKEVEDPLMKSVSPSLMTNINMLCREVVEILKTTDRCQLLLSRYIPAYHHHFGRQCRVADYGFTRLVDLFEAISHVVQVMGSGPKRTITLTHSAQIRRFTSDLLRVIKSQSGQVALADFPAIYEKALNKPFNPVEYGLCSLDDLLEEVPENTVVINRSSNFVMISIPKKEQTPEQMQRTKQFAQEVVELLSHSANCFMLFNKFVPAYHHHFGRQCKVSDYGFAKLAELFEAIPGTVELEGASDVDRKVKLKPQLALKVLGSQIQALIKESRPSVLHAELLSSVYKRSYGFTLKPQAYGCKDFEELVSKLGDFIQVVHGSAGPLLVLTDVDNRTLEIRIWSLLLNPPHSASIKTFIHAYRVRFLSTLPMTKLEQLNNVIVLSNNGNESIVSLTNYYILAAQLYHLLFANGGHIPFNNIEQVYSRKFGRTLYPADYGANSLEDLLKQINFLVILKGKKLNVVLNKQLADYGINLPPSIASEGPHGTGRKQENMPWPPPAAHSLINNVRGITPPKPDTPPVENGWNTSFWNSSPKSDSNLNLSIPLPSVDTSKVFMDTEGLLSPTRGLLCAHSHPLNAAAIPKITAPHPTVLPLPDKLILKDDSSDSGVNSTRVEYTLSDNEYFSDPMHSMGAVSQPGSYNKTFSTFSM